ncbi:hypothetical protein [Flavihumibacter solisilvae]|uniref:hypothetical protein n=1 Tax=Flavihumibacter solisilvae TaxID=1349421 RepID=UPI00126A53D2|nr:hypothetical protein [Flavihumibacter solisilvae]
MKRVGFSKDGPAVSGPPEFHRKTAFKDNNIGYLPVEEPEAIRTRKMASVAWLRTITHDLMIVFPNAVNGILGMVLVFSGTAILIAQIQ